MEDNIYIKQLFQKYINGETNVEELQELYDYFNINENEEWLSRLIHEQLQSETGNMDSSEDQQVEELVNERWNTIQALTDNSKKVKKLWKYWTAVAALLIGIGLISMYYIISKQETSSSQLTSIYGSDVLPGNNRATLLLADGTRIELDSSSNGIQVEDKNISYNNGTVISANNPSASAVLRVPNGGIYRLTLPDGSKVVLNSGSSLTYPLQFEDTIRLVKLEGEGYFEVSPDKSKPFKVQSGAQTLTVLGTHFNIQSYAGERIQTTLLEGKVSLDAIGAKALLSPGQQATIKNDTYHVKKVNAQEAIAWAKNLFVFNNIPLIQIFKGLERWYDVEFIYSKSLTNEPYLMEIPKDRKLSEILSSISELTDIKFKIEGRRVTVIVK